MSEPIGWASMRGSLHYRSVFPTMPGVGMQVNLHKNLSKRLQPKEALVTINPCNIEMARRILHRQRVALRLYSGSRLNLKGSTPHETSARLHRHPPRLNTGPDGFGRENSDAFSMVRSEGSTLLTEASLYGACNLPAIEERRMTPILSSARSGFSENMASYDPEKVPDTRGYLVKLKKPIVYKKKYSESEIEGIVNRLSKYDPATHPAESKGAIQETPSVVSQLPRQSMTRVQKCSAEEVQEIVTRLYKFDSSKCPPESKARPKIYSGLPRKIQTAPAFTNPKPESPLPPTPPPESLSSEFAELSAKEPSARDDLSQVTEQRNPSTSGSVQ